VTLSLFDQILFFNTKAQLTFHCIALHIAILGMSFHPGDTNSTNPDVYVSHSQLFHNTYDGYVGRISKVGGATLQTVTPVITGLPVSHHDHGVNGIDFGDHGEIYIMNGGVRGDVNCHCCFCILLFLSSLTANHISHFSIFLFLFRIQMQEDQVSLQSPYIKMKRSFQLQCLLHIYTVPTLMVLWNTMPTVAKQETMLKCLLMG
jgi:hypothetical protein